MIIQRLYDGLFDHLIYALVLSIGPAFLFVGMHEYYIAGSIIVGAQVIGLIETALVNHTRS